MGGDPPPTSSGTCRTYTMKGTISMPPPTPSRPEMSPTAKLTTTMSAYMAADRFRGGFSSSSFLPFSQ